MRIGIDGCTLIGKRTGVGRYVYELCRALDRQLPQATFYIYSPSPIELPVISDRWILRIDDAAWAGRLKRILWLKMRAGALCKADNLDAFWACGTFLPKLSPNVNTVSTVYDLNYRIVPETMNTATYWAYKLFFKRDIRNAHNILAISQGTSDRLEQICGRSADGVVVPAVSKDFHRPTFEVITATLEKLGVLRPYLLAVGTLEPRKNLALLIEVFAHLKRKGQLTQHQLVLVGGKGWKDQSLKQLVNQYVDEGVLPLGYVAESDLPSLYAGSDAFIFPSVYEGFGMPVLEARACGARIIASDLPEIREAGGDSAFYVSPTFDGLLKAIPQVLMQPPTTLSIPILHNWDDGARVLAGTLTGTIIGTGKNNGD